MEASLSPPKIKRAPRKRRTVANDNDDALSIITQSEEPKTTKSDLSIVKEECCCQSVDGDNVSVDDDNVKQQDENWLSEECPNDNYIEQQDTEPKITYVKISQEEFENMYSKMITKRCNQFMNFIVPVTIKTIVLVGLGYAVWYKYQELQD